MVEAYKTNFNGNITLSILESSTFLLDNRVYEPVLPLRLLLDKRYCYIFFMLFYYKSIWNQYFKCLIFYASHFRYAFLDCYRICYLLLQENPFSIFFPVDTYGPRTRQKRWWKRRILGSQVKVNYFLQTHCKIIGDKPKIKNLLHAHTDWCSLRITLYGRYYMTKRTRRIAANLAIYASFLVLKIISIDHFLFLIMIWSHSM